MDRMDFLSRGGMCRLLDRQVTARRNACLKEGGQRLCRIRRVQRQRPAGQNLPSATLCAASRAKIVRRRILPTEEERAPCIELGNGMVLVLVLVPVNVPSEKLWTDLMTWNPLPWRRANMQ